MRFPTNAQQYVHFRSFIFHLSGCCRIMKGEEGARAPLLLAPLLLAPAGDGPPPGRDSLACYSDV